MRLDFCRGLRSLPQIGGRRDVLLVGSPLGRLRHQGGLHKQAGNLPRRLVQPQGQVEVSRHRRLVPPPGVAAARRRLVTATSPFDDVKTIQQAAPRRILAAATYIFCASAIPALAFGEQLYSETEGLLSAVQGEPPAAARPRKQPCRTSTAAERPLEIQNTKKTKIFRATLPRCPTSCCSAGRHRHHGRGAGGGGRAAIVDSGGGGAHCHHLQVHVRFCQRQGRSAPVWGFTRPAEGQGRATSAVAVGAARLGGRCRLQNRRPRLQPRLPSPSRSLRPSRSWLPHACPQAWAVSCSWHGLPGRASGLRSSS